MFCDKCKAEVVVKDIDRKITCKVCGGEVFGGNEIEHSNVT